MMGAFQKVSIAMYCLNLRTAWPGTAEGQAVLLRCISRIYIDEAWHSLSWQSMALADYILGRDVPTPCDGASAHIHTQREGERDRETEREINTNTNISLNVNLDIHE